MYRTELKRVLIEGGPGAGKTGVITALTELRQIDSFQVVPELATILFKGFKARLPTDPLLLRQFNREFFDFQRKFEHMGMIQARAAGKTGLLMDRGLITRLAFPGVTGDEFLHATGMTEDKALQSYDLVIFMEMPSREVYEACKSSNLERIETYDQAVESAQMSHRLHRNHPNFKVVKGEGSWESRVEQVKQHLNTQLR